RRRLEVVDRRTSADQPSQPRCYLIVESQPLRYKVHPVCPSVSASGHVPMRSRQPIAAAPRTRQVTIAAARRLGLAGTSSGVPPHIDFLREDASEVASVTTTVATGQLFGLPSGVTA